MAEHVTFYFNRSKEDNWYTWQEKLKQPENEAGHTFSYAVEAYGIEDGNKLVEFNQPVRIS